MAYTFYLGDVMLPVPPAQLQLKIRNQNSTITLINEGEINIPKKAGLSEVSFKFLIPQMRYPFARYEDGFKPAQFYLGHIEKLKVSQQPFQFIVARALPGATTKVNAGNLENPFTVSDKSLFSTNLKVLLEDYKVTEDAGNGLDLEIEVNLKQYRDYGTKTVEIKQAAPEQPAPEAQAGQPAAAAQAKQPAPAAQIQQSRPDETAPRPKTYTVVRGDSLWAIAKKFLNNGDRYPEIYSMNQAAIDAKNKGTGNTKYTIYPGQVFILPFHIS